MGVNREGVMDGESGELIRVRRCGRSMNRQVTNRGTGMRLRGRTRKVIPNMVKHT